MTTHASAVLCRLGHASIEGHVPSCPDCTAIARELPQLKAPGWVHWIGDVHVPVVLPILDKKAAKKDAKRRHADYLRKANRLATCLSGGFVRTRSAPRAA